jgi:hypothetical protein
MRLLCEPHGVGKGVVPRALVVDGVALRITGRQRLDQRAFGRADTADQREGGAGRVIGASKRCGLASRVLQFPREVVVRPDRIGDAPMSDRAVRVPLQRLREAGDRFLMMVAKAPVEAAVEPTLGVRRGGGHLPGVGPEIIRVVHVSSSSIFGEVARRPTLPASVERNGGRPDAEGLFVGSIYPASSPERLLTRLDRKAARCAHV